MTLLLILAIVAVSKTLRKKLVVLIGRKFVAVFGLFGLLTGFIVISVKFEIRVLVSNILLIMEV